MDRGAHYVKTDLQVHTPRDGNWRGEFVGESNRHQFAREFIVACRTAGLGAVAITDHHDFGFLPFIRQAAAEEIRSDANVLPEHRQIVVFPGLELSLEVPCQALLIFSADFPSERLSTVLDKLDIDPEWLKHDRIDRGEELGQTTDRQLELAAAKPRIAP